MKNAKDILGRAVNLTFRETHDRLGGRDIKSPWNEMLIKYLYSPESIYGIVGEDTGGVCSRIRNNLKSNLMFL